MRHPSMAPGWIDRPHLRHELGDFVLESGDVIRDAFVSYVLHGDPGRLRDGAILVDTAIGSTHHRLDFLIGEGAALDTREHCVVVVDALGNGLSSSPSNSTSQPGALFPRFSIRDMVESQRRLLDHLGVDQLAAVVGASMGGMQAVQWAVSHPDRMRSLVAMVPMARSARWSQLVNEMSRRALFADADCLQPRPRDEAMRLWVPLTQLVMPRSPEALESFGADALRAWLAEREHSLALEGPDAFDWCRQTWAYDDHDVGRTPGFGGDTARALGQVRARTLVLAPSSDLYNPPFAARAMCDAIPGARFVELPGDEGHASASGGAHAATAVLRREIGAFLSADSGATS
ncbi:MAG: alpha/beta fold hydrolase [Gammaproteobacteria bacterium]|nr:alpha/beta fold hydrolase [Gammaproteobacteria bacterium]